MFSIVFGEFMGIIVLVFLLSTISSNKNNSDVLKKIMISFAIGCSIYLCKLFGGFGHINPAATTMFMVAGHVDVLTGIFVIIGHIIGALVGGFIVRQVVNTTEFAIYPKLRDNIKVDAISEFFSTFLFLALIYSVVVIYSVQTAPIIIGFMASILILAFGEFSNVGLNPGLGFFRQIGFNIKDKSLSFNTFMVRVVVSLLAGVFTGLVIHGTFL